MGVAMTVILAAAWFTAGWFARMAFDANRAWAGLKCPACGVIEYDHHCDGPPQRTGDGGS